MVTSSRSVSFVDHVCGEGAIEQERGVARLELDGALQGRQCLVMMPKTGKHEPEIVVRLGVVRRGPQGLLQPLARFVTIAALKAQYAEKAQSIGFSRIAGKRAPINGLGVVQTPSLVVRDRHGDIGG